MTDDPDSPPTHANDNDVEGSSNPVHAPAADLRESTSVSESECASKPGTEIETKSEDGSSTAGGETVGSEVATSVDVPSHGARRSRRRQKPSHLRAVPDLERAELHFRRIADLSDEIHVLTRSTIRAALFEDEPGPRAVLSNSAVGLSGGYLRLVQAELALKARLEGDDAVG